MLPNCSAEPEYPPIGVEVNAFEPPNVGTDETPVKFNEIKRKHLSNAQVAILCTCGKLTVDKE